MKIKYYLLLLIFLNLISDFSLFAQSDFPIIDVENIDIVRDKWGVPHIYGKTDAETAYGLAWANAEDDFATMQETLLAVKGQLSAVKGKEGALLDALAFIVEADAVVEQHFDKAFSVEFKKVLNGYMQGINAYAAKHPKQVLRKKIFPITEKDLIKGYVTLMTIITNVHYDLGRIFDNTIVNQESGSMGRGSNGIALSPKKSSDGNTYLVANSHQPLRGVSAWYEMHVNSEEGWNFLGGTFPGGVSPFLGTNEHLGWTHCTNYADFHDVYKLKMHPTEKKQYLFDGEWIELEKRVLKLKVKVGPIRIPVKRKFYKSKYGPTFKTKSGYYALRFPSNMEIRAAEQWYQMSKTTDFDGFKQTMRQQLLPSLNTVYADKTGNLYFLGNGLFPKRNPKYNWQGVIKGDTSATLWQPKFMPFDSLVQLENPKCGYIFNSNNTPFNCTCPEENPKAENYNKTMGYLTKNTARSVRFQELISAYDKMSYDDLKKIKYDSGFTLPLYTRTFENWDNIRHLDPKKYPDIADAIEWLKKWDGNAATDNRQAALVSLTIQYILKKYRKLGQIDYNNKPKDIVYANALRYAKKHLLKHFGKMDIPLGDLQVHVRGDKELPIWGLPEALTQMYTVPYKKGKFQSYLGDSYILFATYNESGIKKIETIHCYGASNHPDSPHYDDQMDMYVNKQLKTMTLDKEKIYKEAVKVYQPK